MANSVPVRNPTPPASAFVAIAGWLIPGFGYRLIGQHRRSWLIGISIISLFLLGILVSGIRVVDAPDMSGPGTILQRILQKPWFIGQVLSGPLGVISAWISNQLAHSRYSDIVAHSRIAEIGTLYTAVAGMLNLLAIIDSSYRASQGEYGELPPSPQAPPTP
ncbi:MAG TPA: DUF6677 family protein [Tepidisphaeraceae bacterium]|jgi:hypothetical protein